MHEDAHRSVVQVSDGRGFVVEGRYDERYVVTASHCLPHLPTPPSDTTETTYRGLLGSLGKERTVWAECLFADPVADIAVLGSPDNQALSREAEAYQEFVNQAQPVSLRPCRAAEKSSIPEIEEEGWLFALDASHWFRCTVKGIQQNLWIEDAAEPIRGGMSGSPVLAADGTAISVVCVSNGGEDEETQKSGGPNPGYWNLPGWLLDEFAHNRAAQIGTGDPMKIEGFDLDQIAALREMWRLGEPINVSAFMDRTDIPKEVKQRVNRAGKISRPRPSVKEQADAYRLMQAQIIREVAQLDRKPWTP